MAVRVLIVDDEPLARARLRRMLEDFSGLEIIGEAADGNEALERIRRTHPDAVFLDIRMPLLSGFELLKRLDPCPWVIFTTAYDEYALKAFDENAVDYLLKPVSREKLGRAVRKLIRLAAGPRPESMNWDLLLQAVQAKNEEMVRFSARIGDRIVLIHRDDVVLFRAEEKVTLLVTEKDSYIVPFTLGDLEKKLPKARFVRIHRSAVINLDRIRSVHRWFRGQYKVVMSNGEETVVSRNHVPEFKKQIHL